MRASSNFPSLKPPCAFSSSVGTLVLCFRCLGPVVERDVYVGNTEAHAANGGLHAPSHAEGFGKAMRITVKNR